MKKIKKCLPFLLVGASAGFINGLLGAGGGIIITFFLARALSDKQKEGNGVFANAVATMLPISLLSLALYFGHGYLSFDASLFQLLPSALIGGILGAFLLSKLKIKAVKILFSILVIVSGFIMLVR